MDGKPTLLFIDTVCPRPYDPSNIEVPGGVGGTEMTMVTLAEGLAETGLFDIVVEQHNRFEDQNYQGKALYTSLGKTPKANWVIVLRDPVPMLAARQRFKNAKIYLYSHDLASQSLGLAFQSGVFRESGCLANICVSQWHRTQTVETLKVFGYTGLDQFKVRHIYNPISPEIIKTKETYDRNKLIWLASPHKGLARAYDIFKYLVKLNPDFRLYVTNPGYMEAQYTHDVEIKDRTVVLGTLPHNEVIQHLKTSLCLFYPNTVFPETFGKIMAEANTVGTPVLTAPMGASHEVLDSHPEQIMDCNDTEGVIRRVLKWYSGARPYVRGNPLFKLARVIEDWKRLLG